MDGFTGSPYELSPVDATQAGVTGEQQQQNGGVEEQDDLDLAAAQAADAALASVYSSLGGLGGVLGGFDTPMDAFVDPALAAFAVPSAVEAAPAQPYPFPAAHEQLSAPLVGVVQGSSAGTTEVPDSEDERGGAVKPEGGTVKAEEMEVDILGGTGDEADTVAALKAQASTSALPSPKPKHKPLASTAKSKAARHFASGGTSPAPSPGPSSGLANEILPGSASPPSASLPPLTAPPDQIDPSFHHTGPPSSFIHPRLRNRAGPPLPAAFEMYRAPRGGKHDDSDDEDEETKRRERARRAAAMASRGKRRRDEEEQEDDEEKDDRRYCICKELYQPERMMIACDKCEEWYHVDCVGIAEDAVELVDLFICPNCSATSLDRTTWKAPCQRPLCRAPAVPLSKFCSDYCGILVASSRLSLLQHDTGLAPEQFYPLVRQAQRKESAVTDQAVEGADSRMLLSMEQRRAKQAAEFARLDEADARTRRRMTDKLVQTDERRRELERSVQLVELRLEYLKVAIRRWEALCQATADELQQAGIDLASAVAAGNSGRKRDRSKKKKGPVAATSLPDAQCGLDVRLVYDDANWAAWVADDGPEGGKAVLEAQQRGEHDRVQEMALEMLGGVCLETRKRCERHTGWQKLREADFGVEKIVLQRRLDRLTQTSQSLNSQIAAHDTAASFRRSTRGRTADPERLIDVEAYLAEREEARPRSSRAMGDDGDGGGGARTRSRVFSPELGEDEGEEEDEYEIPADVLPFLSRAEIARMKQNRGRV